MQRKEEMLKILQLWHLVLYHLTEYHANVTLSAGERYKHMPDVFDVAKYILNQVESSLTTFKLQKLVYYSQAWSLVWDDAPLFDNKIYAWMNGPVCFDLYNVHEGLFEIDSKRFHHGNPSVLTKTQTETIDLVIESYGKYSGQELSNLSHTEEPWINARKGLEIGERGRKEITPESMVEYFSGLYAEQMKENDATKTAAQCTC